MGGSGFAAPKPLLQQPMQRLDWCLDTCCPAKALVRLKKEGAARGEALQVSREKVREVEMKTAIG